MTADDLALIAAGLFVLVPSRLWCRIVGHAWARFDLFDWDDSVEVWRWCGRCSHGEVVSKVKRGHR